MGCENIITECSASISAPLRLWTQRTQSHDNHVAHTTEDRDVVKLDEEFRLSCHRDLLSNAIRLRLYLDERTAAVLLQHVQDRIVDEYMAFREMALSLNSGEIAENLLSAIALRALLRSVCVDSGTKI